MTPDEIARLRAVNTMTRDGVDEHARAVPALLAEVERLTARAEAAIGAALVELDEQAGLEGDATLMGPRVLDGATVRLCAMVARHWCGHDDDAEAELWRDAAMKAKREWDSMRKREVELRAIVRSWSKRQQS